jgi:hypothetical protein
MTKKMIKNPQDEIALYINAKKRKFTKKSELLLKGIFSYVLYLENNNVLEDSEYKCPYKGC